MAKTTYELPETERLLKEKKTASGIIKVEAVMMFNHKIALDFFQQPTARQNLPVY